MHKSLNLLNLQPVKSHFKEVKGQMDSSGRLRFGAHTSWQTEEQKAALASYMVEGMYNMIKMLNV